MNGVNDKGESYTMNPRWLNAPFEIRYFYEKPEDGLANEENMVPDQYPFRFETAEIGQKAMETHDKSLSVPWFLVTRDDGSTYESW